MVRGILQFTPGIAFRYVLHRCESRDIRCRESLGVSFVRGRRAGRLSLRSCSLARRRAGVFVRPPPPPPPEGGGGEGRGRPPRSRRRGRAAFGHGCAGRPRRVLDNDPSAGSPTETLLRLLLPLNDKVQWTSRDVASGGPPASPRSEHFTGPFNR